MIQPGIIWDTESVVVLSTRANILSFLTTFNFGRFNSEVLI